MSKKRSANPRDVFPKVFDGDGKPLCGVCKKPLKGRQRRWCSVECSDYVNIVTSPSFARHKVALRDKGVCSECGCDTAKLKRILKLAGGRSHDSAGRYALSWMEVNDLKAAMGFTTTHYWEMDHIQAVIEGGGLCGLDNLRTLCIPCHHEETRQLARRRAAERKNKPLPLFGD